MPRSEAGRLICPVCGRSFRVDLEAPPEVRAREEEGRWFPFCSERCRLTDLGRWAREDYRISEPLLPGPEEGVGGGRMKFLLENLLLLPLEEGE